MSARKEKPAPLQWWLDTVTREQWTALNGYEVRVWNSRKSSGPWARPWRIRLLRDERVIERAGQCKSESSAKASAEKRLRKAAGS